MGKWEDLAVKLSEADDRLSYYIPDSIIEVFRERIRRVLGRDLPDDFERFYGEIDGFTYEFDDYEEQICEIDQLFGSWKHAPDLPLDPENLDEDGYFDLDALERIFDEDAEPFYGQFWLETDFEEHTAEQINVLKRQKLLVSVIGVSAWVTVDFFDPERDYRLYYIDEGELLPLEIKLDEFVENFIHFGLQGYWPYLYVRPQEREEINLDLKGMLESGLAAFQGNEAFQPLLDRLFSRLP